MIRVIVNMDEIDVAGELAGVEGQGAGAVATFTGLVRADDGVGSLELEHYPEATETALAKLADTAAARWKLIDATIVHRVGILRPGNRIVFVGVSAPHRAAALEACAFLIDRLKTDAPFWKRETRDGSSTWVEAREGDADTARRWIEPDAEPKTLAVASPRTGPG